MKLFRFLSLVLALAFGAAPFLFSSPLRAQSADADLDSANLAYQEGHYEDAAKLFGQLIADRGYSAPLCFDLGNAEFKAGHLGLALLNYERARYLAPGDGGIEHNLQLARRQAGLEPNPYRWWQVVLRSIDWSVWMAVIVGALLLLLLALVGRAYAEAWAAALGISALALRSFFKGLIFICVPLFLFFGFVELSAVGLNDRIEGVIVAKNAALRLSPFESAEQTGTLPEGELVTVEKRHDDYFWVDERSRQSGWVQEKALAPILPGSLTTAP
jgi:tetratricopeptide (TPR) repeat protein